ncbi:MAG: hypothetical protein MZV49_10635 [Rhodopseudomonas palustris]|nr:hypothetical protein [Rhodopseudomonas palustris]
MIIEGGPIAGCDEQFFVDSFNVFLVALTAFVGFTTSLFSRPYMRIEREHGRLDARPPAPLPQHVPALHVHDAAGAHHQQHGHPVGGDGGGDARHRAAGVALPHAGEPRGGVEVLHPVRRRHRAGAVRHDPALLRGGEGARRRGRQRAALDAPGPRSRASSSPRCCRLAFVFLLVGYGTKVGPGAAAQLAAGRPRRGPDAGLRGALRAAAQRRAVRGGALQGAGRRRAAVALRRRNMLMGFGLLSVVLAAFFLWRQTRHQAPVRLLVDRAHGHHHLRVRHGRRRWPTSPRCCT